nr:tetratricopeptide repeat protein [uncultured Pseudodesulfovibrio sp.]
MKRITIVLAIVLALVFGMTVMSPAEVLPKLSFSRHIDRALKKERWGHPEEAKEYWQKALECGDVLMQAVPDKMMYFVGSARCCYALGEYERAVSLYNQALKIKADMGGDPDLAKNYPWVLVYLGLTYAKLGDTAKTVEAWEQVPFTIGSTYTTIQDQLAKLKNQQTAEVK